MNNKVCSLLGLAMRAGKLKMGEDAVLQATRGKQAKLVMIAADASPGTTKKVVDKCRFYQVPVIVCGSRQQFGQCIGKEERVLLAVMDEGFASAIASRLDFNEEVDKIEKREG